MRIEAIYGSVRRTALAILAVGLLTACENPLGIEAPGILTSDELTGPASVPAVVNGIVGDFAEALDSYARYAGLFTDEFILAGTFPTRLEFDERRIVEDNATMNGAIYEPLSTARFTADTGVVNFEALLNDAEFADVRPTMLQGIAFGKLFGGFSRVLLAEGWCQSAVARGPFLASDDRMTDAITFFVDAEQAGADAGMPEITSAAIVGQARAHLFLGSYAAASAAARRVPAGFEFAVEYSVNDNVQFNEVHSFTWGAAQQQIRWTVGDGTEASRNNERFAYFNEWVILGRIDPSGAGLTAQNTTIDVHLQQEYDTGDDPITIATKAEADMIEAEVALRNSLPATANGLVNPYRATWGLAPLNFSTMATLSAQLTALAQERSRELWLTGQRQATSRRYRADGVDLYTDGGSLSLDQTCWPVPKQEVDNNPNSLLFPNN